MWDLTKVGTWLKLTVGMIVGAGCVLLIHKTESDVLADLTGVLIGIFAEIVVILMVDGLHIEHFIKDVRARNEEIVKKLDDVKDFEHAVRYYNRLWTDTEVPKVWIQLLSGLETSYIATNYIVLDEIYRRKWAEAALAIQSAKKLFFHDRLFIRKVFIVDEATEIVDLSAILAGQRSAGIEARYLYRHEIEGDEYLRSAAKQLPSIDFGIFDQSSVLVWHLKDRKLYQGQVLFGKTVVDQHAKFLEALYDKAQMHDMEFQLLPWTDKNFKEDRNRIGEWEPYVTKFELLDYALRKPNGWLYTFGSEETCVRRGIYLGGQLIGFSLLNMSERDEGNAEFYVAIRHNYTNQGWGAKATREMMRIGFEELKLKTIWLKVRRGHPAKPTYKKAGYRETGTAQQVVDGVTVDFDKMTITSEQYMAARANGTGP